MLPRVALNIWVYFSNQTVTTCPCQRYEAGLLSEVSNKFCIMMSIGELPKVNNVCNSLQVMGAVTQAYLPADHQHNHPQVIGSYLLKQSEDKSQQQLPRISTEGTVFLHTWFYSDARMYLSATGLKDHLQQNLTEKCKWAKKTNPIYFSSPAQKVDFLFLSLSLCSSSLLTIVLAHRQVSGEWWSRSGAAGCHVLSTSWQEALRTPQVLIVQYWQPFSQWWLHIIRTIITQN